MEKEIKFLYFDVANTLLHKPALFEKMQTVLHESGLSTDYNELQVRHKLLSEVIKFPDQTNADFYHQFNEELLRLMGILPDEKIINRIFRDCSYLPWQPYDDFIFLQDIILPKGIISNWDSNLQKQLELLNPVTFSPVIGSMEAGISKPGPELYRLAIQKSGVKPGEILYIGDSVKLDIEPALKMGIKAVLIDRLNIYPNFSGIRIQSFSELKRLINN